MTESARNGEPEHGGGAAGRARAASAAPPSLAVAAGYRRAYLPLDLVAGVTLVAIAIPEQLATAHLAGMPVVAGLYAFLAAVVMFALLGSNRTMSVGADSTIAPMLAVAVAAVAGAGLGALRPATWRCWRCSSALSSSVVGVARMGWIADFLSVPVVTGFLAGIAVTIIVGQLPAVLGLPTDVGQRAGRSSSAPCRTSATPTCTRWPSPSRVFAVIVAGERVSRRLPGALHRRAAVAGRLGGLRSGRQGSRHPR